MNLQLINKNTVNLSLYIGLLNIFASLLGNKCVNSKTCVSFLNSEEQKKRLESDFSVVEGAAPSRAKNNKAACSYPDE